jgi:ribosome biogenesis protein MAK21
VIARDEKTDGKSNQEKPKVHKKTNDDETLRQEILAMGGTEEDLELLAGVDSESEVEGETAKGDDDLRKQLASMLEAAGHVVPEDLEDDEVEEIEEEPEESEDEIAAEDSEDNAESSGAESDIEEAPAKKKESEATVPKEFLNLVSCGMP